MSNESVNPSISVIIPAYNAEEYLEESVSSVLSQTCKDIELIIIDDGSTDNTDGIIKKLKSCDKRILSFRQENAGQGTARNVGIRAARGQMLAFLDADDYFCDGILEKLYIAAKKNDSDVVIFNGTAFYDDDVENLLEGEKYFKLGKSDSGKVLSGLEFAKISKGQIQSPCMKLYKREFLMDNNVFFPEGGFGEDTLFFYDVMILAQRVCYVDEIGYMRRYHTNSTMTQTGVQNILNRIHTFPTLVKKSDAIVSENYKYEITKQYLYYACLLWIMAMNRKDRDEKAMLIQVFKNEGVQEFIKENHLDFVTFVFSVLISFPTGLSFLQDIAAKLMKILLKKRTRFAI